MKKSKILDSVHRSAKGLHDIGLVDVTTMRKFDALCLPPIKQLTPNEIKSIRKNEKVSQPVFAKFLNVSPSTVKKWESGEKHPAGASVQLLNVVRNNGLQILHEHHR